jgi:peptidoglycan/LPS O-acetylase OafA/YrhL
MNTDNSTRLFFLDHLRASLAILVVLHHVAVVYGGIPPFYYWEPVSEESAPYLVLLTFVLNNQAWFMGAFFLLAGYFTPGSYERRGAGSFLKARLVRLGIPLLVFIFVLNPLSTIAWFSMPASVTGNSDPFTWQAYPYLLGAGPLWFVAMLLIFSFGYAAWRGLTGKRTRTSAGESSLPSAFLIGLFILALAVVSYVVRIIVPLGEYFTLFVYFLSFPTMAYFPQYLSFFVLGAVASRHDWFRTVPRSAGVAGYAAAVVAFFLLFVPAFLGCSSGECLGNGHWQSAVYALWDSITVVGMCLGLVVLFRRFFSGQGGFGRFLSKHSYAVFVLHIPVVVYLAVALRGTGLAPLLKFVVVSAVAVPASFAVAAIIRSIPGVSRVL